MKRQEAAAVRLAPALRKSYLPTHFNLPILSPALSDVASLPGSPTSLMSHSGSLSGSILGLSVAPPASAHQGDMARLTNTLRAVVEVGEPCWRGDDCELSNGMRVGLGRVAEQVQIQSELSENRVGRVHASVVEMVTLICGPDTDAARYDPGISQGTVRCSLCNVESAYESLRVNAICTSRREISSYGMIACRSTKSSG